MNHSAPGVPGYFSRVLGRAPAGASRLRAPRQSSAGVPPEAVTEARRPQAAPPEVRAPRLEQQLDPAAEVPAPPPAGRVIEQLKSFSLPVPAVMDTPEQGKATRLSPSREMAESAERSGDTPAEAAAAERTAKAGPDREIARERVSDESSVLEQIADRAARRYNEEPVQPPARETPAGPPPQFHERMRTVQGPAVAAPAGPPPAIEIGHVEIRLQPPAPAARTASARPSASGPLTRPRYIHGLRQS